MVEGKKGPKSCSILELQQGAPNTVSAHLVLTPALQDRTVVVAVVPFLQEKKHIYIHFIIQNDISWSFLKKKMFLHQYLIGGYGWVRSHNALLCLG